MYATQAKTDASLELPAAVELLKKEYNTTKFDQSVEAAMNKVSWPSRGELLRAVLVVIFTILFLATALFGFDLVWHWLLTQGGAIGLLNTR